MRRIVELGRRGAVCMAAALVAGAIVAPFGDGHAGAAASYPKINLAVGYEVDPAWPAKPDDIEWQGMTGLAVGPDDRVWVLSALAPHVQVYSTSGELLDTWDGLEFKSPHHVCIDHERNVWIADHGRHVVEKYTPAGELLLRLGTLNEPGEDASHFNRPTSTAVSPGGDVFITDGYGNNRIVHFDARGRFVKAWGTLGVGGGELSQPHAIAMDTRGRLYVGERNNCRIQIFDQDGRSLGQWRNLVNPWGLWITPRDEVYVCGSSPKRWGDAGNLGNPPTDQLVMRLDTTGRVLELWTFPLAGEVKGIPGELDWVHGIAVDSKGDLYLSDVGADSPCQRAQKFIRLPAER
ncbi:MAG: hypothetical protein JXR94_14645 [Candidatus Hydrogenedentes bacterium]|nr:hypothetical protein [Candidatus Hydrogenedentota bacterium]